MFENIVGCIMLVGTIVCYGCMAIVPCFLDKNGKC